MGYAEDFNLGRNADLDFKAQESINTQKFYHPKRTKFTEILEKDYLIDIQKPFSFAKGLVTALFDADGSFICSGDPERTDLDPLEYGYIKQSAIRINHEEAALFVCASHEEGQIERFAEAYDAVFETLSKMANAYVMLSNSMDNAKRAYKLLGENAEQQVLLNSIYTKVLNERNSVETVRSAVSLTGVYLGLDRIMVYEDVPDAQKYRLIYEWEPPESEQPKLIGPDEFAYADYPKLNEELNHYETYFSNNPKHVVLGHEFSSYVAANLTGDGKKYGIIIYEVTKPDRLLSHSEKLLLRNISQIIATVLMRCKDNEELDKKNERLAYLAFHDPVLGVKNKIALGGDLKDELDKGAKGALIAFKIINMKTLNHIMGHHYTDGLVLRVMEYISDHSNYRAEPYRFSDNVFMILLRDVDSFFAREFCESLTKRFGQPWSYEGSEHYFEIGAGVAPYPESGETADEIYKAATMSMHKALQYGANTYAFFAHEFEIPTGEDYRRVKILRESVERGMDGFAVKFQPVFEAGGRRVKSCEALISIGDAFGEFAANPARLIRLAESTGLDIAIDDWVLRNVCNLCKKIRAEYDPDFTVSVNTTARELTTGSIVSMSQRALRESGLEPSALSIEVSEHIIAAHYNVVSPVLGALKKLGVTVTIDNIGSQYIVPSLIKHSCVSTIKSDVTLFSGIYDEFDRSFTDSLFKLAQNCGVLVCVKKIESEEQLEYVANADLYQGYLYGKPMEEKEFMEFMETARIAEPETVGA